MILFFYFYEILKESLPNKIIEKILKGDKSPIFDLYQLYRNEFISWSGKQFSATENQSKDAFQEAIIDFHQNIVEGKLMVLTSSVKTYLFQIGKFKLINIQKKESRLTYHDSLHMIKKEEVTKFMEEENSAYTQEHISKAIGKLPDDCQKLLRLYYFEEYDMESIAREMGYKNADTAKSKKSVCMKNLIKELKKLSILLLIC